MLPFFKDKPALYTFFLLFVVTAVVLMIGYFASNINEAINFNHVVVITLAFFLMSFVFLFLFIKRNTEKPRTFILTFLSATFFKLFVYMALLIIMVTFNKSSRVPIIITFLALYFVYTPIDVFLLLKFFEKKH